MFADYIKERENAEVEYNDKGFMSYKNDFDGIFILDAYTKPMYRKYGVAKVLLKKIVEKTGAKKVYTTTDIKANGWELSEKAILALGFQKLNTIGNLNYYKMEIK